MPDTQPNARESHREALLARFPVFAELPATTLDRLLDAAPLMHAPAGAILFDVKQPCRGFPLLLEGLVRVARMAPNGREIALYHVEPGEGCVLSGSCLLGNSLYSATGVVKEDAALLSLPSAQFHELILASEPFRQFVFDMYGSRLADVMELVEEVAFRRLDERLAQLLVRRGPVLSETHQKLADDLGSVREIVSRLLRSFESRGWVRLERERITVLDGEALDNLAARRQSDHA